MEFVKNPLFWISLISALSALGLFLINRKMLNVYYSKPKIEIISIVVAPTEKDGSGGFANCTRIEFKVMNSSAFGNHVSAELKKSRYSHPVIKRGVSHSAGSGDGGIFHPLPTYGSVIMSFMPEYEAIKKYLNKKMTICLTDVRGKKVYKNFILRNFDLLEF
jgi:hypothetical protein